MFNAYTLLYELNKNIYGQIFFYVNLNGSMNNPEG